MDRNYDTINIISKYFYFKKAWSSYFIFSCLLKQLINTHKKFKKKKQKLCIKIQSLCLFLDVTKFDDFR